MGWRKAGCVGLLLVSTNVFVAYGQTASRDAKALQVLTKSLAATSGSVVLADITLNANVQYQSGSTTDSGTATLEAKGGLLSSAILLLGGGRRAEIRNSYQGLWSVGEVKHAMAIQNSVTPATWFIPDFLIAAALQNPAYSISYIAEEEREGAAVHHVQITGAPGLPTEAEFPVNLTSADLYLDTTTLLPLALTFNLHPDTDALKDLPVEIRYGAYQPVGGLQVPMRITKLFLGTVSLEITVTKAAINSGISDTDFSLSE